ncbi:MULTISPECIES: hypothetical protein [unclassified Polaromonas]|uniref:hypothetical protein n=1 Tax=unclassified Polaromonas TaxID=2638319 RepID=UPI00129E5FAB|nr:MULTISPECIES: hypothetical protein [unclassified Polaromonas]QGJ18608.1 hypothetical protein F7R28_09530 [Polaromonas sp. Pch-P]
MTVTICILGFILFVVANFGYGSGVVSGMQKKTCEARGFEEPLYEAMGNAIDVAQKLLGALAAVATALDCVKPLSKGFRKLEIPVQ